MTLTYHLQHQTFLVPQIYQDLPRSFQDKILILSIRHPTELESDFLRIARSHNVTMICCAHITGYDRFESDGMQVIVSGGGGGAVNKPPYDRIFDDLPPNRGGFMHFVEITVQQSGKLSGRVFRVSGDRIDPDPYYQFQC